MAAHRDGGARRAEARVVVSDLYAMGFRSGLRPAAPSSPSKDAWAICASRPRRRTPARRTATMPGLQVENGQARALRRAAALQFRAGGVGSGCRRSSRGLGRPRVRGRRASGGGRWFEGGVARPAGVRCCAVTIGRYGDDLFGGGRLRPESMPMLLPDPPRHPGLLRVLRDRATVRGLPRRGASATRARPRPALRARSRARADARYPFWRSRCHRGATSNRYAPAAVGAGLDGVDGPLGISVPKLDCATPTNGGHP